MLVLSLVEVSLSSSVSMAGCGWGFWEWADEQRSRAPTATTTFMRATPAKNGGGCEQQRAGRKQRSQAGNEKGQKSIRLMDFWPCVLARATGLEPAAALLGPER